MDYVSIFDESTIRAHAYASSYQKGSQEEQALGRSKGGFTTEVHALVDALGLLIKFILTPGQSSEIKQAPKLIQGITGANILGDKALTIMNSLTKSYLRTVKLSYLPA